jgi:hypothetical protein
VVNYDGTGMVPLYPCHPVSSSSSALTARSYQSSTTFSRPQVAFSALTTPAQRPFAVHGSGISTYVLLNFYIEFVFVMCYCNINITVQGALQSI